MVRASGSLRAEADALADRLVERRSAAGADVVRAPPVPSAPPRGRVEEATLRADEAFASLALGDAEREIDLALQAADEEGVRARSEIVAVLLLAAMVRAATGDEARADEAARGALAIDPALAIDLERYPPTLAARIDRLRPDVARCPLSVVLDPRGATVEVDGVAGPVPETVGCGTHWLTVSHPGYATLSRRVVRTPGASEPVVVTLSVDPASALAALGSPGTPIDPLVERGAAALGRRLLVLDVIEDGAALRASLAGRTVRLPRGTTPDALADALLAPVVSTDGSEGVAVGVGIGVGVGAAAAIAIAIGLGVALTPAPSGWVGVGEVLRP